MQAFPIRLRRFCAVLAAVLFALLLGGMPAPIAMAAPAAQLPPPTAVARFDSVDVYSGPGVAYKIVGTITYGQGCTVTGRDTATGWWLVLCPAAISGWVAHASVTIIGDSALAPLFTAGSLPAALPPSPPAPAPFAAWRGSYFANQDLAGVPVLVQETPVINFDWGFGSPTPTVPADHFSVRYERTLTIPPGSYLLTLRMDDGARLFIDDQLMLDDWRTGSLREVATVHTFGSSIRLRLEYFEAGGAASIFFAITPEGAPPPAPLLSPGQPPAPDLPLAQDQWRSQFFNNTDLGGSPAVTMDETRGLYPLDRNWGTYAPAEGIGADFWSARFEGRFHFAAGDYEFSAVSDDGVRVYIDDILLINAWYDGRNNRSRVFAGIEEGWHTVRVEFYKRTGSANLRVWWSIAESRTPVSGPIPPPPTSF